MSILFAFVILLFGVFGYLQNKKTNAVVKEEDFVYRLVTEKAQYSDNETVKIYNGT
ncbi:hypothetical protein [Lysinibacillus telephonicus]|uniref:hypothetical protein n=1 Tax=Lysinibacillus telephonicus TaxID=1714840 RepID=UPI00163A8E3E|nr:hypothetical protein [Lysinibacillus telephonicus]